MAGKPEQDAQTGRFVSGNIGGPGRGKGNRNKLGEAFVGALFDDFTKAVEEGGEEQGAAAIAKVRETEPASYLRVIAQLMPKEVILKDELTDVSDDELAAFVLAARQALSAREGGGSEASVQARKKQAKAVPPVQ